MDPFVGRRPKLRAVLFVAAAMVLVAVTLFRTPLATFFTLGLLLVCPLLMIGLHSGGHGADRRPSDVVPTDPTERNDDHELHRWIRAERHEGRRHGASGCDYDALVPERTRGGPMVDFERVVSVQAAPEEAFRSLTDPGNLPRYVATMVSAESLATDRLHVTADVQGRREEGDARFRVDEAGRRMEWSGEGESGYRGWLEVVAAGEGSSVTIHLEGARDDERDEIDRALDETAANIERMLSPA